MGSNLCIANEIAREQAKLLYRDEDLEDQDSEEDDLFDDNVFSLGRLFSYALLREDGQLWKGLAKDEIEALQTDSIDDPEHWQPRNAQQLLEIFRQVKERLERENEQMPVDHLLWYVDEEGNRFNGSTKLTLPWGGIQLLAPPNPFVRLDGDRHDPEHRWELCQYNLRIDADLLDQSNRATMRNIENFLKEKGINSLDNISSIGSETVSISFETVSQIDSIVAEPAGWIPVQPVLDMLGWRVEVKSKDALDSFLPDLNLAIECYEEAISENTPFYWLVQ